MVAARGGPGVASARGPKSKRVLSPIEKPSKRSPAEPQPAPTPDADRADLSDVAPSTVIDVRQTVYDLIGFVLHGLEESKELLREHEQGKKNKGSPSLMLSDLRAMGRDLPYRFAELTVDLDPLGADQRARICANVNALVLQTYMLGAMTHYSPEAVTEMRSLIARLRTRRPRAEAKARFKGLVADVDQASERLGGLPPTSDIGAPSQN